MKIYMFLLIISALNINMIAADQQSEKLNSTIQNELRANIKFDQVLAEKLLILDLEDELTDKYKIATINRDFIKSQRRLLALDSMLNKSTIIDIKPEVTIAE